jgi:hypothetical protein
VIDHWGLPEETLDEIHSIAEKMAVTGGWSYGEIYDGLCILALEKQSKELLDKIEGILQGENKDNGQR